MDKVQYLYIRWESGPVSDHNKLVRLRDTGWSVGFKTDCTIKDPNNKEYFMSIWYNVNSLVLWQLISHSVRRFIWDNTIYILIWPHGKCKDTQNYRESCMLETAHALGPRLMLHCAWIEQPAHAQLTKSACAGWLRMRSSYKTEGFHETACIL